MAQRNVIWSKTADDQFLNILEYWINRNKSKVYSQKLLKKVDDLIITISEDPFIFRKSDFCEAHYSLIENFSLY